MQQFLKILLNKNRWGYTFRAVITAGVSFFVSPVLSTVRAFFLFLVFLTICFASSALYGELVSIAVLPFRHHLRVS